MRYEFDTTCRLYNIGRTKRFGEEEEESESDENEENGDEGETSSVEIESDEDDAETTMKMPSNLVVGMSSFLVSTGWFTFENTEDYSFFPMFPFTEEIFSEAIYGGADEKT